MAAYGKILLIAMPAFLFLVLFEKWYGWWKGKDTVRQNDMISSLSSGATMATKDVLGLSLAIISYEWLEPRIALTHIQATWAVYLIAFVALDFGYYWIHRIAHEFNFFWNNHIIHHSSEEFNLACALRQSISVVLKIHAVFIIPAALLGIPAQVIATVAPLHLFAQFWYHTQHIGRMGFLEKIIVTPSHHRVHHAINPIYLDKNYSGIFIIWDKMFGTFQEEMPDVPAVYGVTRPVQTWNPIKINFLHLWLLIKDAWRANSMVDKFRIWFMPLGWRPADVAEKYPIYKIKDVYNFEKYDPKVSSSMAVWSWIQLTMLLLFISYLFGNVAEIGSPSIFWYGAFVFMTVYSYTELLDKNKFAYVWELAKNLLGVYLIWKYDGWFGLDSLLPYGSAIVTFYLGFSSVAAVYFSSSFSTKTESELKFSR